MKRHDDSVREAAPGRARERDQALTQEEEAFTTQAVDEGRTRDIIPAFDAAKMAGKIKEFKQDANGDVTSIITPSGRTITSDMPGFEKLVQKLTQREQ